MSKVQAKLMISNLYKYIANKKESIGHDELMSAVTLINSLTKENNLPDIYVKKSNVLLHSLNSVSWSLVNISFHFYIKGNLIIIEIILAFYFNSCIIISKNSIYKWRR